MGQFVAGDIVVILFPFSDLSGSKHRPAFVIADLPGDDIIICQITSRHKSDPFALPLTADDFISGSLPVNSFIRPNRIFTADKNIILSTAGRASGAKTGEVVSAVINIITPKKD
ncbi:MAG: type II toxin-antitoxin system PemK/MazF family toxin [Spirochaetales bacterium]|jgi:mRNA interferase MazF|nr:type II toxin-antitoxin system PemK/MazF family toxin [Spirochaetales bacterium]